MCTSNTRYTEHTKSESTVSSVLAAAICCVISVVDPSLIVLGGGIGQAPGFAEAVTAALAEIAPVLPEVKVSALGTDVVVDGCLAEAAALAWTQLIASLP